jgi:MSHA biogenesis protein MshP
MNKFPKNISVFNRIRSLTVRGFSLISAIFLLVVLAGLGVAMVSISTVQNTSSALDIQGARAYQAARAGVEWGAYQYLRNSAACNPSVNIVMPADASLAGFTVTVICTPSNMSGISTAIIRATACNLPNAGGCPNTTNRPDYVQRVMEVRL